VGQRARPAPHRRPAPSINEVAFLHKPSRTLLLTDWLFNFNGAATPGGRPVDPHLYLRLDGAYHGPRQSRLLRAFIADKHAARELGDRLLAWDFDRIIVCHGDIIDTGGHVLCASHRLAAPDARARRGHDRPRRP
jgi:hypothetical protein